MEENKIKHQTSSLSRKIKRKGDGNKGDKKQRLCRDAEESQALQKVVWIDFTQIQYKTKPIMFSI